MYSAQDVADILSKNHKEVTKRTINYYAFEKKMFEVSGRGKNSFTDEEIKKIENILLLKEKTSYTLEQISKIINTKTDEEIKAMFEPDRIIKTVIIDPEGEYEELARKTGSRYIKNIPSLNTIVNPFEIDQDENILNFEGVIDRIFNELDPYIDSSYKMSDELYSELSSTVNLKNNTRNIIKKYK